MSAVPVLARGPGVLWRRTLRGVLISVLEDPEPFLVTTPGDAVWELLEEPRTRTELVAELSEMFDTATERIDADIAPVLSELIERGAIIER
jgi:hypothetical protein